MQKDINILLIDDEEDFLEITAKRLSRRGYYVVTALNCKKGLQILETFPANVIVLDVMLPDRDGIACLQEIKKRNPSPEVILLTGHASIETGLQSLRHGASDYCLKPVDFEELVDRIEIVFRDSSAND